jgi:hypothetical protein
VGIDLRPTWVAFTPWTTLPDYVELLDFHEDQALIDHVDPIQYSLRLLVPPGSLLLASAAMRAHLGSLEEATLSYRWTHPDPRMDHLQEAAAAAVTEDAERGSDPAATFGRIRALADEVSDAPTHTRLALDLAVDRRRPPRLTEPWFC